MSMPVVTQTWLFSLNNRITYVSLTDLAGHWAFLTKNFLVSTLGCTVVWSASNGTGPSSSSDHTDRITSAATWTPRSSTGDTGSQAWVVLQHPNGSQTLINYQGTISDDQSNLTVSPGGLFVLAGTTTHRPTAVDEIRYTEQNGNNSMLGTSTSGDRIVQLWGTSDGNMFRSFVCRAGVGISFAGLDKVVSALIAPATHASNLAICGHGRFQAGGSFPGQMSTNSALGISGVFSNSNGAQARVHTNIDLNISLGSWCEALLGAATSGGNITTSAAELQGGASHLIVPIGLASSTASGQGKFGMLIDWWGAYTSGVTNPALGDTYQSLQYFAIGGGMILPWDGATSPVIS